MYVMYLSFPRGHKSAGDSSKGCRGVTDESQRLRRNTWDAGLTWNRSGRVRLQLVEMGIRPSWAPKRELRSRLSGDGFHSARVSA